MRRKAKRDLIMIFGVAVVLSVVVFANATFQRNDLWTFYEDKRIEAELERSTGPDRISILPWELLQRTKGTVRKGATYHEELHAKGGQTIHIMGYMQPLNEFREMSEFMMLPVPIECYFCRRPPLRDIVLVHLRDGEEKARLVKEPMLVRGVLALNKEPGSQFFYTIDDATIESGKKGAAPTNRYLSTEHMIPDHEPAETELLSGQEPPSAVVFE